MDLLNPARLDKTAVGKFSDRAAKSYDHAAIFQQEVLNRLLERLRYIRHQPETIVDIGCGTGRGIRGLQQAYPRASLHATDLSPKMLSLARRRYRWLRAKRLVCADMERLPYAAASFDLVFSSLALPWANDLRATLAEFARVSRPGALLMFASLGPGTLIELARSCQALDPRPRVHPFVDMHDVGDAMMAAGFAQPVVDAETLRLEYTGFRSLLRDLRDTGASNARLGRRQGLMTPAQLRRLESAYREHGVEDGKFVASFEVVYGHAWAVQTGLGQDAGGTIPCG